MEEGEKGIVSVCLSGFLGMFWIMLILGCKLKTRGCKVHVNNIQYVRWSALHYIYILNATVARVQPQQTVCADPVQDK